MPRRNSKSAKVTAAILLALWLFPLFVSFAFYVVMVIKAVQAGNTKAALLFTFLFCAVCLYLYRTFAIRDAIRSWFR